MKIPHSLFRATIVSSTEPTSLYPFFSIDKNGDEHIEHKAQLYSSWLKGSYAIIKLHPKAPYRITKFIPQYKKGLVDIAMQYGKPQWKRWGRYLRDSNEEIIDFNNLEECIEAYRLV